MRPVPESQDALTLLTSLGEGQMRHEVEEAAAALARLVQGIAAFSVAAVRRGITLTYVTTSWESARLDAVQYADDGPCEEAVRKAEVVATDHDGLMDEGRWLVFAQTTAAAGIRSTLSLPVLADDVVVGGHQPLRARTPHVRRSSRGDRAGLRRLDGGGGHQC